MIKVFVSRKIILLVFFLLLAPLKLVQAMTVEDYCSLTREIAVLSIEEWQEKSQAVNNNFSGDVLKLTLDLQAIEAKYMQIRTEMYDGFQTNNQAYMQFIGKRREVVQNYFDNNPSLKIEIEMLAAEENRLAEEVEAVMEAKQGVAQ